MEIDGVREAVKDDLLTPKTPAERELARVMPDFGMVTLDNARMERESGEPVLDSIFANTGGDKTPEKVYLALNRSRWYVDRDYQGGSPGWEKHPVTKVLIHLAEYAEALAEGKVEDGARVSAETVVGVAERFRDSSDAGRGRLENMMGKKWVSRWCNLNDVEVKPGEHNQALAEHAMQVRDGNLQSRNRGGWRKLARLLDEIEQVDVACDLVVEKIEPLTH